MFIFNKMHCTAMKQIGQFQSLLETVISMITFACGLFSTRETGCWDLECPVVNQTVDHKMDALEMRMVCYADFISIYYS